MTVAISRTWRLQADHFEWITDYLSARGMTRSVRLMMGLIALSLAACLIALLCSPDGPTETTPVVMTWIAFGGGVAGVVLWAWRWPSHAQSVAFVVVSNASIALACLAYPDAQGAITGCISFATIAAYIAFFHSTALVLYNLAVAAVVGVVATVRLASAGHVALAAVDFFIVLQINIAMPVAIHVLVRSLGVDLVRADRDPLTGLLNRRAFGRHVLKVLSDVSATEGKWLTAAMIDLDDFKRINDTYGHQVGDETLVAVARELRHAMAGLPAAAVGRSGGEEFVVIAVSESSDPEHLARRICEGIAALPDSVTASVGTACMPMGPVHGDDLGRRVRAERLFNDADAAMYEAKRAGGNRHHHCGEL